MLNKHRVPKDNLTAYEMWLHLENQLDMCRDIQTNPEHDPDQKQKAAKAREIWEPLAHFFSLLSGGEIYEHHVKQGAYMRLISVDQAQIGHCYSIFPLSMRQEEVFAEFMGFNHNKQAGIFRYESDGEFKPLLLSLSDLIQPVE